MFYAEALLAKSGKLASVWLAANLERKVTKKDVVLTRIDESVDYIASRGVAEEQGPWSLRSSAQLLLGVVRIYSRKTHYLLEECNETIQKIKMLIRSSGNVDLPRAQQGITSANLTLPDVLTEFNLLAPLPDPSLLLTQPFDDADSHLNDFSQLHGSLASHLASPEVEVGRDYRMPDNFAGLEEEETLNDVEIDLTFGDDTELIGPHAPINLEDKEPNMQTDVEVGLGGQGMGAPDHLFEDVTTIDVPQLESPNRDALSESPLSDALSMQEPAEIPELHLQSSQQDFQEELDEESVHQAQRAKKRKGLRADVITELRLREVNAQQKDRSKILQPLSYLPKDPMLMALMEMQRTGGFVSNILGDGRSKGWAPELRGILSLEVVRESRKRKRGTEQVEIHSPSGSAHEIIIPEQDDTMPLDVTNIADQSFNQEIIDMPANMPSDADFQVDENIQDREEEEDFVPVIDNFDQTEMPLVHPNDSGPVSVGTKHAVHLLRERFGQAAADSPRKRQQNSVLFQELLPEATTTRADATKMFFETLVLATKDAIKVEQAPDVLGGPLRIRGRRGLWGEWAEMAAGGEVASNPEPIAA